MDIFAAARGNVTYLEDGLQTLLGAKPASETVLRQFAQQVENQGCVSINMRQSVLISFLSLGRHQNIYEWADYRARMSGRSPDAVMRERLGSYYEQRIAFDNHFDHGRQFRYGALNIGGLGTTAYGEFATCLDNRSFAVGAELAYLRTDSLKTYLLPGPAVDEVTLCTELAPHSHRQFLAVLKLAAIIPLEPAPRWPVLLCSCDDYVEAIFTAEVTWKDVAQVRMGRSDHELLFEYAFNSFREPLSEADRSLVNGFVLILQKLEEYGIPLEVVDEA